MEIVKLDENNIVEEIVGYIKNQKEGIVWGIPIKNSVFVGNNTEFNKNYCIENDIGLLKFPNEGGVIVVAEGDFDIGHFSKKTNNTFNQDFAKYLVDYLIVKGIDAKFDGNDLIIDNKYKCGSHSSRRYGEILYSAFHISINCDIELIKNICYKQMIKIPKGLSEYGINTQQIKSLFLTFAYTYKD